MAKTKKSAISSEKEMTKKEEYIEQRQEKLAAAREALVTGIKALETDEDWKTFLNRITKRSRFSPGRLSFGNQMLVYIQFPEATNVATYRSWYRIGRWPIKGSHGIMIFQPRPYMKKVENENGNGNGENGNDKSKYKSTGRIFFKPIYLFDISQTEGKDPPEWLKPPPPPKIENKEIFANSVEKLSELIKSLPESPVNFIEIRDRKKGERPDVHGWYERNSKAIVVYKIDNRGQMFKTLVHEIAHAIMHVDDDRPAQVREVEAESVAYVVNKTLGLDTSDYSFKYVASWSGMKSNADEAIKLIERSGQRIVSTANMILDVLMPLAELPDEDEKNGSPDKPEPVKEESTHTKSESPTPEKTEKRGPGRPKGSKSKQIQQPKDVTEVIQQKKKQSKSTEPKEAAQQCEIKPRENLDNVIEFALNNKGYVDDTNPSIISFDDKYKASLFRIELVKNGYAYTEKVKDGSIVFEITCGTPTVTATSIEPIEQKRSCGRPKGSKNKTEEPKPSKSCRVAEPKELERGIDYYADTDMNGEPVNPGDYVSFKTYPKGTGRGIVIVSKREMVVLPNGSKIPALAINSDGTTYGYVTGGVKKLKHQSTTKEPEPKQEYNVSEPKRGKGRPKGSKNISKTVEEPIDASQSPKQFKKETKEPKNKEQISEPVNESKSRKPRSGAYSLKQGTAFELIGGEWDVSMTDDMAVSTAKPIKRQIIDTSECIIFEDSKGRKWAQTEEIARNRNNKRALKKHMLEAKEKADCICLGKTSKQAGKTEKDFDKKQLAIGVKVELEHTDDIDIAKRIAMDHLTEDKDYYIKLTKAGL